MCGPAVHCAGGLAKLCATTRSTPPSQQVGTQRLTHIRWQTPVDLFPPYSGNLLYIHYGSPLITPANTVIVPVRTSTSDTFRVEAHRGGDGTLIWSQNTDYIMPPHQWRPSMQIALTAGGRVYIPGRAARSITATTSILPRARVRPARLLRARQLPGQSNGVQRQCLRQHADHARCQRQPLFRFQVTGSNPLQPRERSRPHRRERRRHLDRPPRPPPPT